MRLFYYQGQTFTRVARRLRLSVAKVQQLRRQALYQLARHGAAAVAPAKGEGRRQAVISAYSVLERLGQTLTAPPKRLGDGQADG